MCGSRTAPSVAVQLLSRSWTIVDGRGTVHEVVGEGVVGEMPLIAPGASFDYVSGCPLDTPTGAMSGSYRMVDEDGTAFDVDNPALPAAQRLSRHCQFSRCLAKPL